MKFKDLFKKGDEQREPAPRKPPNKLSKPRTNNNSNLNLLSTSNPNLLSTKSNINLLNTKSAPASRRNSILTNNEYASQNRRSQLPSEAGDSTEKQKDEPTRPKQKRRLSLFRSRSEKVKERVPDLDLGISTEYVEPSPVDPPSQRWSRQPSTRSRGYSFMTEPAQETPQFDLTEDMEALRNRLTFHQAQAAQYEQQLNRLSRVTEVQSPPLPTPEPKELSRRNSKYEPSEDGTQTTYGGSRRGSDAEKYGPIRRRSLMQHGIATRPAFPETDARRSLPSQSYMPVQAQSQYNSSVDTEYFPPTGLVTFGPSSAFSTPSTRTETPTELDYRHTGAFKLGSLRITNGAASPTPSRDGRAASLGAEDNYIKQEPLPKSIEIIEQRHGLNHRSQTLSVPAEGRKVAPWVVRSESPLRQATKTEYEPLAINIPDPSFALFDFKSTKTMFKSTHSPTKSLDLALEYQQEIASSPFSPFSFEDSPLPSPRFESTSKNTAIEDDLFAAELDTPSLEGTPRMPRSFDSAYEGGPAKDTRELDIKPLAKADSGYSSILSNRSFRKEGPKVPPKDAPTSIRETFVRVPSSIYSVNSSIGPETSLQESVPPLPVKNIVERPSEAINPASTFKSIPYEQSTPLQSPSLLRQSVEQATIKAQPHLQVPKSQSRRKSLPAIANSAREMRANSPADSEKSVKSVSSSGSSSIWQRKKPSKRISRPSSFQPKPEPVYTIQAFRSPSEVYRIPVPPMDIRRQLDERVESFPTTTFSNTTSGMTPLRRTASKETLGTIFSVGSAEVRDEVNFARLQGALPAIPTEPTIIEDALQSPMWNPHPGFNKRHTFQAPSPIPAIAKDWAPRSSFDSTSTRQRSRDRNSLPAAKEVAVSTPQALPEPIQAQTPRKSFQKNNNRDASPSPSQPPPSRASSKTPSHNSSPAKAPTWNPRRSFQKPPSRDPSPAPIHRELSTDFETHITSFDAISSSLGKSPYELALSTMPNQSQFQSTNTRAPNHGNPSQESRASTIMRPQRSYESIRNSNPWSVSVLGENNNKSVPASPSTRGPPSAHSNGRRPYSFQQALSRESLPSYGGYGMENEMFAQREMEMVDRIPYGRPKAGPPVSMGTRNDGPAKNALPSVSTSLQNASNEQSSGAVEAGEARDPWKSTAGAWAERRKSAGQALVARKSFDASGSRPVTQIPPQLPRSQTQAQEPRGRKSMDARSHENEGPRMLQGGKSFDYSQQQRQISWGGNGGNRNAQHYEQPEYNHTYGSPAYSYPHPQHDKENMQQEYSEPEYYDPETEPAINYGQQQRLPETIHQRKTSTSEMLVLEQFKGVMDNGYGERKGTTGEMLGRDSKSGSYVNPVTQQYGVDLVDVPIIVQRVRTRG